MPLHVMWAHGRASGGPLLLRKITSTLPTLLEHCKWLQCCALGCFGPASFGLKLYQTRSHVSLVQSIKIW